MTRKSGKMVKLMVMALVLLMAAPVQTIWAASDKVKTKIKHKPPKKEYIPGFRIQLDAKIKDKAGLLATRCYFKAKKDKIFTFINMNNIEDNEYRGILPAPWVNSEFIEYVFVTVNKTKQVTRTQTFKIEEAETEEASQWKDASEVEEVRVDKVQEAVEEYDALRKEIRKKYRKKLPKYQVESEDVMTVFTEVDESLVSLNGFYDGITVSQVPASSSYGVLAEGLYTAEQVATIGGTAAASSATGATTAETIAASTGLSTGAIVGIGAATAVVIGGGAAAGIAIAKNNEDDDDAPEGTTPCDEQTQQGSDAPETHQIYLGKESGTFVFEYDTYSVPDRMRVTYEGRVLFDTGCVGRSGRVPISYSGNTEIIGVHVTPNCSGTSFTGWEFTVRCP